MSKLLIASLLAASLLFAPPVAAQSSWTVRPEWVRAHASFLASEALQGRGSATRDEAIAAAYVGSMFQAYGLRPAPGMTGYLQTARVVRLRLDGAPALAVNGTPIAGAGLLIGSGGGAAGKLVRFDGDDPKAIPAADVVIAIGRDTPPMQLFRALRERKGKLLIVRESDATRKMLGQSGGKPRLPSFVEGEEPRPGPSMVALPDAAFDRLAAQVGSDVALTLPGLARDMSTTTNAIGYLPGRDPAAGVLLFSAHLDHLGVQPDGTIMPGANDDASGTTAVLEIAHALAASRRTRRGILFVAYGSEEIGGFGSNWFARHPPVPLTDFAANIEFEMIGSQDPKLPIGSLMMTGFERSNLGEALTKHGAFVSADPYLDEHFFERSDNYALALRGIVAHTISGWAVVPTYHQPTDTYAALDVGFMTRAIQSLIKPARWLANSKFRPDWRPGGKPVE
jgi:aminopeptidase YwaD